MHFAAHHGLSPEKLQAQRRFWPARPDRGSAAGRAILGARVEQIADIQTDAEYKLGVLAELVNYRSLAAVPLLRDGVALGAIAVARSQAALFPEQQIKLLQTFADQAVIAIENVRLFEEVQARTAELQESLDYQTATSDVLNVISRSPNKLQPVLDAIVRTAAQLCSAEYAFIARLYDGKCHLAAANNVELDHIQFISRNPVPINRDSILGRVALDRRTIHSPDVLADPEFKRPDWQAVGKQRTVLGVPLLGDGTLLGVIILARTEARPFTEKQIDLVTTFADQAVIAVNNVGLFEEVQARTAELRKSLAYQTATSEVLNVISRSPSDIQPVLDAIVDTAARLCRGDFAIVWKLHEGRYHAASVASDTTPELAVYARANPIDFSRETLVGRVALERETVHIPDVTLDAEYRWSDGRWAGLLRTMLGVPLLRDGAVIGVIAVHRRKSQPFSEREIELVTTFADQAVIAISNVGLFEEVQARTAELQQSLEYQTATSDVLSAISRSPSEIQPVLDTIVETAGQLCDAKRSFIYRYDGSVLRHQASHNASPELVEFVTQNPILPGRHSGAARAAVEKRTIHISDVRSDPEYTFGAAQVDPIRTVLAVPMLKANDLVGVLVIYRLEVRPFTEKQIELVTTFADQAVIAIENVRLFEEVKARTREVTESLEYQTATSDVLNIISRSPNQLQPVLEAIVATDSRTLPIADPFRSTSMNGRSRANGPPGALSSIDARCTCTTWPRPATNSRKVRRWRFASATGPSCQRRS
jgi:GAF domain-containing protein